LFSAGGGGVSIGEGSGGCVSPDGGGKFDIAVAEVMLLLVFLVLLMAEGILLVKVILLAEVFLWWQRSCR
jgi:hypothetical protein